MCLIKDYLSRRSTLFFIRSTSDVHIYFKQYNSASQIIASLAHLFP